MHHTIIGGFHTRQLFSTDTAGILMKGKTGLNNFKISIDKNHSYKVSKVNIWLIKPIDGIVVSIYKDDGWVRDTESIFPGTSNQGTGELVWRIRKLKLRSIWLACPKTWDCSLWRTVC